MKNACYTGDRVEVTTEKGTKGIVIDLDTIENEGGCEPRAKVMWKEDSTIDKLYLGRETWVCEGNLTMIFDGENLMDRNH